MAFAMCSCATYSYTITGNVALLSNDGNVIEQWDNATLQQGDNIVGTYSTPYKNGGVEVTTEMGERIYINGGIIIVRNIKTNTTVHTVESDSTDYPDDDPNNYGG